MAKCNCSNSAHALSQVFDGYEKILKKNCKNVGFVFKCYFIELKNNKEAFDVAAIICLCQLVSYSQRAKKFG